MNSTEGGSLFLKSFTESCVKEAIRQEGHIKYNERVRKGKEFWDILLEIIVLSFRILLLALRLVFWVLFYVYAWVVVLSFIFVLVMTSGIVMYVVYEDIHFGTCPLVRTEQDYADVYCAWLVDMMTPLVKDSQTLKRLYEHWEFGKSRPTPLYLELKTLANFKFQYTHSNKEAWHQIVVERPPGPQGPYGPPGRDGPPRSCGIDDSRHDNPQTPIKILNKTEVSKKVLNLF